MPRIITDELAERMTCRSAEDFVFTAPSGGVLLSRNFRRRVFDPACIAAGLDGLTPTS